MRKQTWFMFSVLVAAALVLSACAPSTAAVRNISVTGNGAVSVSPDIAYIYMGVHTEAATASAAVTENNVKTQKLIDALKAAGVDEKDIRTTNFSIWPSQQYDAEGNMSGTVYMVDNTVYLTVRDLTTLGDLLDSSVRAGANSINSIQFDVADKTAALSEARKLAVENAGNQAKELASAAGVTLGAVQNINYYDSYSGPVYEMGGKGGGGAAAMSDVPIQPGQYQITVSVTLTYEIK